MSSAFRPHPLLHSPHLQTILPALFRPRPRVALHRERIELDDGDFVDLGWLGDIRGDGPIAILLHGLGGGLDSGYALGLGLRLNELGWRPAILQLRGAGPEPNRLARCYHHGDTADIRHICALLQEREPGIPLFAAGWSLGANVLLKMLGEDGDASPLQAAVAASAPFLIGPCAEHLRHGFARVYQHSLMKAVRANLSRKHGPVPLPPGASLAAALRARDFFGFDDAYTAPINGFLDARDYYRRAACGQYLHAVRRPTLIVHALDDPLMLPSIVPKPETLSASTTLELSRHGGHVGFVAADARGRLRYWLEERFTAFLESARMGSHIASP